MKSFTQDKNIITIDNLENIPEIPNSSSVLINVEEIPNNFLRKCSINTLIIGEKVKKIAKGAFYRCRFDKINVNKKNKTYFSADDNCIYTRKNDDIILIQGSASSKIRQNITEIGYAAFRHQEIKHINIPNSCKKLGNECFMFCTNLSIVNFSKNIERIPTSCFSNCYMLKDFKLPEKLKYIGESAFSDCWKLSSLKIPKTVEKIDKKAFFGCQNLNDISFYEENIGNSNLKVIGTEAFRMTALDSIHFPAYLTNIGKGAFSELKTMLMVDIELPPRLSVIESDVFRKIPNLKSIVIPENIKKIKDSAFASSGLTSVVFKHDDIEFNTHAFTGTSFLRNNVFKPFILGRRLIAAHTGTGKKYTIPPQVEVIMPFAFAMNTELEKLDTNNVKEIQDFAIYNCMKLESINAKKVEIFGSSCIRSCPKLHTIDFKDKIKQFGFEPFYSLHSLRKVKLPATILPIAYALFNDCKVNQLIFPPVTRLKAKYIASNGLTQIDEIFIPADFFSLYENPFVKNLPGADKIKTLFTDDLEKLKESNPVIYKHFEDKITECDLYEINSIDDLDYVLSSGSKTLKQINAIFENVEL